MINFIFFFLKRDKRQYSKQDGDEGSVKEGEEAPRTVFEISPCVYPMSVLVCSAILNT